MIQDDEFEVLVECPERAKALGFKPQQEVVTNRLLPYADELDKESQIFLEQVKTNLSKAVILREMKPACGVWTSRLMKYLRIYGLKFSKEDHIAFVKLAYELVLVPDLEPCKIHKFATLFLMLTKKRHLISPEELTLPWRPLYDVGQKIFEKNTTNIGLYHYLSPKRSNAGKDNQESRIVEMIRQFLSGDGVDDALYLLGLAGPDETELPTSLETSYMSMVKNARPYFGVSATAEILEEFLPRICPWSNDSQTLALLSMYLPVELQPKHAAQGHELWFDELMTLWDTCYNAQCGICDLMTIFAGLAKRNPGAVDWSPLAPKMFMRFLHALNLPVSYKEMQYSKNYSLYTKHIASWIVWAIRPDGVVLGQLRSFLAGVESYLHSANTGRWSYKLRHLLRKLAREFLVRVRREREKRFKKRWENQTPREMKLRDEDITEFVSIVLEPTLQAVYSRGGTFDISGALHNLATLRPALVVPPLLERLNSALDSLTEPHRVTAAMAAVAAVARPLLLGAENGYPAGPTHTVPLLLAVLPGLDPNDIKKTLVTLHFILVFSWMVPYIDCSSASDHYTDLTEEELLTCESTAQMEDFVLIFLDRLFAIIESSANEHVRLDTREADGRSKTDAVMETALSSAATAVLMQCSPAIFKEALRKFKAFATESTFETNVSGSMVGVLLRVFARVDPSATLAAFLPTLCAQLDELLASDDALADENPPRAMLYRLVLLMNIVECEGAALVPYAERLEAVLGRALRLHNQYAVVRAAELLAHLFSSLSCLDLRSWRSSAHDYGAAPQRWLPVREWGHGCLLRDAAFEWFVPGAEEARFAQRLFDLYVRPEVARLEQWLAGERAMCRERRLRALYIVHAALAGGAFLPLPEEPPEPLAASLAPPTAFPFTTGLRSAAAVTLDGRNVRAALTDLLERVQARLLAERTDDTRGLETLVAVWERLVVVRGRGGSASTEARMRSYGVLERALDGHGVRAASAAAGARLRMLLADAARLQDEARLELACDAGVTATPMRALHALLDLSVHVYTSVRASAQARLYWMVSHYAYSYRALVPRLAALLAAPGDGDEGHARHKGTLYVLLGPRAGPLVAKQDWDTVRTLWPAVLNAPLSEKPSLIKLEQAFADTLHRHFPTVNTRLRMSDGAIAAARHLAPVPSAELVALEADGRRREEELSARNERSYLELVGALVAVADAPSVPWRRLELAVQMLAFCPSVQTAYPVGAVRLALRSLVHDDIAVRRTALRLTHYVLKQRKRPLLKVRVDPYEVAGVVRPARPARGYRPDLQWAMWAEDSVPRTDDEWDRPWLRNPHLGFYAWPRTLEVAAPTAQQRFSADLDVDEMEEGERLIHEFFTDDDNVDRLVGFFSVEEKKGKDKFNALRCAMFRMLFAQFGERAADKLVAHALRCAGDAQEAPQRFAAEVAAAGVRAPRYWPRARALAFHSRVLAVLRAGLAAVTPDTMEDWGTCLATGLEKLDPRRGGELLDALVELCAPAPADLDNDAGAPDRHSSFVVCARLYALQGALGALTWRAAPLAAVLLRRLDAADFIQHPYQNVRETVGSMLMTLFDNELVFPGGSAGGAPRFEDFLASVRPRLAALYDENGDIVIKTAASLAEAGPPRDDALQSEPEPAVGGPRLQVGVEVARLAPDPIDQDGDEPLGEAAEGGARPTGLGKRLATRLDAALQLGGDGAAPSAAAQHARAVSLLTTVLRGCMGMIVRGVNGATRHQYSLVPTACALAARGPPTPNDELPRAADGFLASLARQHHSSEEFDVALEVLERLAEERSWWARLACLDFAQPLLFYGLPMVRARPERAVRAERFALRLMRDARLEVRAAAARLLTGLMHCRALPDEDATLRALTRSCRAPAPLERHCGVLGLCAYLASRPYSLGPRLGAVLAELARHTSAPDPVPATIRKALADFRRTHHDDWPKHRDQLTEEELDLLADLTSPPTYCA